MNIIIIGLTAAIISRELLYFFGLLALMIVVFVIYTIIGNRQRKKRTWIK